MEISGFLSMKPPANPKVEKSGNQVESGNFSKTFTKLVNIADIQAAEPVNSESSLEMELDDELIQLLETPDLLTMDEKFQPLIFVDLRDEDLFLSNVAELLGMSKSEAKESLIQLAAKLLNEKENNEKAELKLDSMTNEAMEDSNIESLREQSLASIINLITTIPVDKEMKLENEMKAALQILKLYELLNRNQNGALVAGEKLQQFITKMNEWYKHSGVTSTSKLPVSDFNKLEYLHKTFQSVWQNSNQQAESKQPVQAEVLANKLEVPAHAHTGFTQPPQMSKTEQLTLMLAENGKPVSPEQMIKQFDRILSKAHFMKNGDAQKLLIKLSPEHLGSMRIEIIQKDSMMVARILTSTAAAKEMLDSNLQSLRHAFSSQNLTVERLEISQQAELGQERFFKRDEQQGGNEKEGQPENKREQADQELSSFLERFEEELLNLKV
ncbi:flagellar hook-length control protein FliK [Bacillus sp. CRN 9]|nr:flagellar hook-length control protein FliK [Bacillus sp. CRN 9]